jgi:hypothetical protein
MTVRQTVARFWTWLRLSLSRVFKRKAPSADLGGGSGEE